MEKWRENTTITMFMSNEVVVPKESVKMLSKREVAQGKRDERSDSERESKELRVGEVFQRARYLEVVEKFSLNKHLSFKKFNKIIFIHNDNIDNCTILKIIRAEYAN